MNEHGGAFVARSLGADQICEPKMEVSAIAEKIAALQPNIPWNHIFDFGGGVATIRPDQERNFAKARGLKKIGRHIIDAIPSITAKRKLDDLTVLDLACAEGQHAIEFAGAGAKRVVGIEGRQLYVDRAKLVADGYGLSNVEFRLGDVREVGVGDPGLFDLVLFFGILHHLDESVFFDILCRLRAVTGDALVLYTHTSEKGCEAKFGSRLSEEIEIERGYRGRRYLEHPQHATPEQRAARVRNSLDNTYAFWARENSLIAALRDAGFGFVSKLMYPNPFGNPAGEFRVLYVCR